MASIENSRPGVIAAATNIATMTVGAAIVALQQAEKLRKEQLKLTQNLDQAARAFLNQLSQRSPEGINSPGYKHLSSYWSETSKEIGKLAASNAEEFKLKAEYVTQVFTSFLKDITPGESAASSPISETALNTLYYNFKQAISTPIRESSSPSVQTLSLLQRTSSAFSGMYRLTTTISNTFIVYPVKTLGNALIVYPITKVSSILGTTIGAVHTVSSAIAKNLVAAGLTGVAVSYAPKAFTNGVNSTLEHLGLTPENSTIASAFNSTTTKIADVVCHSPLKTIPFHFSCTEVDPRGLSRTIVDSGSGVFKQVVLGVYDAAKDSATESLKGFPDQVANATQQTINEALNKLNQIPENIAQATKGAEETVKEQLHSSTLLQVAAFVTSVALVTLIGKKIWDTVTYTKVEKKEPVKKG